MFDRGFQLRDEARTDEAIDAFRRALERCPWAVKGWLVLGSLYRKRREYAEAVACFQAAVALRPDKELCSLGLFHSLIDAGRYAEGAAEAARFLDEVEKGAKCPVETRQMYRDWIEDTEGMAKAWERHRNS